MAEHVSMPRPVMNPSGSTTGATTRVETRRVASQPVARVGADPLADLERVRRLAELLDSKFSVGGIRFGLDAIVGLIPILGDAASTLVALYPIYVAQQHKVGLVTRTRMLANVAVDWAVGIVPLLGDVFDVGFKANLRNLALLEKALKERLGTEVCPPAAPDPHNTRR